MNISEVVATYPDIQEDITKSMYERRAQLKKLHDVLKEAKQKYTETLHRLWKDGNDFDAILFESTLVGQNLDKRLHDVEGIITNITAYLYEHEHRNNG
jgi:hypothetical protein